MCAEGENMESIDNSITSETKIPRIPFHRLSDEELRAALSPEVPMDPSRDTESTYQLSQDVLAPTGWGFLGSRQQRETNDHSEAA